MSRRAGIYEALEERLRAGQFGSEEEALTVRNEEERRREEAEIREDSPHGMPKPARQKTSFVVEEA